MIHFYFHPTPNPAKVALFLEESGLPYEMVPVDTSPHFSVCPNGAVHQWRKNPPRKLSVGPGS